MEQHKIVVDVSKKTRTIMPNGSVVESQPQAQILPLTKDDLSQMAKDAAQHQTKLAKQKELATLPTDKQMLQAFWQFALTGNNLNIKQMDAVIQSLKSKYPEDVK
jgi:hypothetical protein